MSSNNEPRTTVEWMQDHLLDIANAQEENGVFAMDAPEYLKVIALSLHTLATIEHIKLKSDGRSLYTRDQKATLEKRIEATEAIIQNHERWGNV